MKLTPKNIKKIDELVTKNYSYNYKTHSSRWVDVDNVIRVYLAEDKIPSVKYDSWTVWHKKHPWKGTSANYTFNIPLGWDVSFIGNLLTFTKGKKAFWVKQARGCDISLVEGYLYKGYHLEKSRAKNYKDAVLKITAKRNKTAKELLRSRVIKNIDLKKVWIGVQDSYNGGNCAAGTENFVSKIKKQFGEIGGIRADYLLEIEDSMFTRRAVNVAKMRYLRS